MAIFKTVAMITLSNIGGDLDSIHAKSTTQEDIREALIKMVSNGIFEIGDSIHIEEIETEIE
jgi:hypothetical protein